MPFQIIEKLTPSSEAIGNSTMFLDEEDLKWIHKLRNDRETVWRCLKLLGF
jgi:hypothetical protein